MTEALLKQIEAAKAVLNDAEKDLQAIVEDHTVPGKVEGISALRAVSLRLKAAEAQLIALDKLLALANIEAANLKVETARTAVIEAEKNLEKVVDDAVFPATGQDAWVTEVVAAAFAKLRTAKAQLLDLETSIASKKA